jgi:predicted O-methyltransferase YrrM
MIRPLRPLLRRLRARALNPVLDRLDALQVKQAADARRLEQVVSLLATIRPRVPLPPFGGYAVRADFATLLVMEASKHRPACVVELGSGLSTLILGYALEGWNGHLWSIEHEADYARRTRAAVVQHELDEHVTVLHAPLEPWDPAGRPWYGRGWLGDLPPIDLLVVDGPPGTLCPMSRYPALPVLAPHLAPGAVIVVDDAAREDERAMVRRWLDDHPAVTATDVETEQGAVVLRWTR